MPTTNDEAGTSASPERPGLNRADTAFLALTFLFVYTQLFQLPFTPIYFDGDTLVPVSNAIRILNGDVIYRDFFHFITPGADVWYAAAFSVFGRRIWVINVTILILTMAQVTLIWRLSRSVLYGWAVYLPVLIFLALGFRQFSIDGSYRLFSLVFALSAIAVLLDRRTTARVIAAGALCAAASAFQQPRGVLALAGVVIFLVGEAILKRSAWRRSVGLAACCIAVFTVAFALSQAYFVAQAGWDNYYASTVEFIRNNYRADPFNNNTAYLSDLFTWINDLRSSGALSSGTTRLIAISAFYYLIIPYIYLALFAYVWIYRRSVKKEQTLPAVLLIAALGICLTAGVSAPTIIRVFQVAAPGLIVLIWLAQRHLWTRHIASAAAVAMALILAATAVMRQMQPGHRLEMPAGEAVFLYEPNYLKYKWMAENTRPGDVIYEPHHPNFYFPFALINPTPLYMARDSEYTPAAQVDAVVRSLDARRPRLIIWPTGWKKPASERAQEDHLAPLWELLQREYTPVYTFPNPADPMTAVYSDSEVWRRIDKAQSELPDSGDVLGTK